MRADSVGAGSRVTDSGGVLGGTRGEWNSLAVGPDAVTNLSGSVSIQGAYTGQFSVAIGDGARGGHQFGVSVGYAADSGSRGIAFGYRAKAGSEAFAIGTDSSADHFGIAIGVGVVAARNQGVLGHPLSNTSGVSSWLIPGRLEVVDEFVRASPDGARWNIVVDNAGAVSAVAAAV